MNKSFTEKIVYLIDSKKYTRHSLAELFIDEVKMERFNTEKERTKYRNSRRKVVKSWYDKGLQNKDVNPSVIFNSLKISKLEIYGKHIFTEKLFFEASVEEFKVTVDNLTQKTTPISNIEFPEFKYKYICYFDNNLMDIHYLEIQLLKVLSNTKVKIKLIPSIIYKEALSYVGELVIVHNYYYLWATNNQDEIISSYFFRHTFTSNITYGLKLGLSCDLERLPIASTIMLSKKVLNQDEKDEVYLYVNESESLILNRINMHGYSNLKMNFQKKIQINLEDLALYSKKIRDKFKDKIFNDIYFNIYYKSFLSLSKISVRVSQDKTFYVANRERAISIFLKNVVKYHNNSYCYIVYPLFRNHSYMFGQNNVLEASEDIKLSIRLAKLGLKVVKIFVINEEYSLLDIELFSKTIKAMQESGIEIKIVYKKDIESNVVSYDFIYNIDVGVAGYRNIDERKCYFKISKDIDKIKNLRNDFQKIKDKSYSLETFLKNPYFRNDDNLNILIGEWHFYSYGSMKENKDVKIWDILVTIKSNKEVTHIEKKSGVILVKGTLNTTYSTNQSFIKSIGDKSKNLSLMILDNREIHKDIFRVSYMDKIHGRQKNMAVFGIFSKIELTREKIIEVLGQDTKDTQLIESLDLEVKINNLNMKVK